MSVKWHVASRRFAGCRPADQKHACSLKQDRVSCSTDHIVIERAGVAHRLILFIRSDVGSRSDTRGCPRSAGAHFFGREDPADFLSLRTVAASPPTRDPNRRRE